MTRRLTLALLIAIVFLAPLAGCGKKSDLEQPGEVETDYPRKYPR